MSGFRPGAQKSETYYDTQGGEMNRLEATINRELIQNKAQQQRLKACLQHFRKMRKSEKAGQKAVYAGKVLQGKKA